MPERRIPMFTAIAFLILLINLQSLDIVVPKICWILPCFTISAWALFGGVCIVLKIIDSLS